MCKIDKLPIINGFDFTTTHPWDGGYSTSINVCGIWTKLKGKNMDQGFFFFFNNYFKKS